MQIKYETKRLVLLIADESHAALILDFLKRNHESFAPYEPSYPENYYTLKYQMMFHRASMKQFLKSTGLRYYLFEKGAPETILGCVAVSDIKMGEEKSCSISYKLDKDARGMGFAHEAVEFLIDEIAKEWGIHRIEADILPENEDSIRFAKKLGFDFEGIAKSSHKVQGCWKDHARYAKIIE
ncbi:MAG: GNAT family N-acetyltransferase [Lachnospiraceae bacterium]|nr:GNAT family N-acetyltransferase [Lachnospiraceae bacterium]